MYAASLSLSLFWTQQSKQVTFKVPKCNAPKLYIPSTLNTHIISWNTLWHFRLWSFKIQNKKGFCIKINLSKENYWILRIGLMGSISSLGKSEFLKLISSFFHYFWCQNWDQWHKMSGKNTHIFFSTFGSKINEFERKKSEKIKKIPKT